MFQVNKNNRYQKFLENGETVRNPHQKIDVDYDEGALPFIIDKDNAVIPLKISQDLKTHGQLMTRLDQSKSYDIDPSEFGLKVYGDWTEIEIKRGNFYARHCRVWPKEKIVASWSESSEFSKSELITLFKILDDIGDKKEFKYHPFELDSELGDNLNDQVYTYDEFLKKVKIKKSSLDKKIRDSQYNIHLMGGKAKKALIGAKPKIKKDPFADYYTKNESIVKESPDTFTDQHGKQCFSYDKQTLSFIVNQRGDIAAGVGITHNNIQNCLYFLYNDDGSILTSHEKKKYTDLKKKINIYSDNEDLFIKQIGKSVIGDDLKNHVRKNLKEFAVGRIFKECEVVSFWNKFHELTKTQKDAIFNMMYDVNLFPDDFSYEVNPPNFVENGDILEYDDFIKDSENSIKSDSHTDILSKLHTMDPKSKKFTKKGLGDTPKPKTPIPYKWKSLIRQENFKYYAFDWDDNLLYMPTSVYLKTSEGEIEISTKDYSEIKTLLKEGKPFEYKNSTILGLFPESFINFRVERDDKFIEESLVAEVGPAWNDFKEAVNSGRIFSIITARGHSPSAIQEAVRQLIINSKNGLSYTECVKALKSMHDNSESTNTYNDDELFDRYLTKLCKYYPTTYNNEESINKCHHYKEEALNVFYEHVKTSFGGMSSDFKNRVSNNFIIGFSDDDIDNIKHITENVCKTKVEVYSSNTGELKKVESRYQRWKK